MEADREFAMKSPKVFTMMVRTASAPKFPNQSSWETERGLWSVVMMTVSPGWNSVRLRAGGCEDLDLLRPQKCSGEDLAHRDTQGLWGPGSHAPPQGSSAALRPRHP